MLHFDASLLAFCVWKVHAVAVFISNFDSFLLSLRSRIATAAFQLGCNPLQFLLGSFAGFGGLRVARCSNSGSVGLAAFCTLSLFQIAFLFYLDV